MGTGLVEFVTPEVKLVISPTTLEEKFWIPLATDAAKSAPGSEGSDTDPGADPTCEGIEGVDTEEAPRLKLGS